jgi:hypothetical protein
MEQAEFLLYPCPVADHGAVVGDELSWRVWPSTPEEHRRSQIFRERATRYGSEVVPKPQVYAIMTEIVAPAEFGMVEIRPRVWARRYNDEHASLLWFRPMKGAAVQIAWGTSASYVPSQLLPRPAWTRTLKQSRPTLGHTSRQIWPADQPPLDGEVHTFNGPVAVANDTRTIWQVARPHAEAFWRDTATPEGVLAEACAQHGNIWHQGLEPDLAATFAAARMADREAAAAYLWSARLDPAERETAEAILASMESPAGFSP